MHKKLCIIGCFLAAMPIVLLSADGMQRDENRAFADIVFVLVECNQPPLMSFL